MTAIITRQSIAEQAAEFAKVQCPTDKERNAAFRAKVYERGGNDSDFAQVVNLRCASDPVFDMNTFGWTQNPKDFPQNPDQPIILFPNQANYIRTLDQHVEMGKPLLLEKSREQLASVGTANYCGWRWNYKSNANIKIGSMKEELVDGDSYADQIMPKIDYSLLKRPEWARPAGYFAQKPYRTFMKIRHPVTGRIIKGEAANKNFSVGGRYAMVWYDEFSKAANQRSVHRKIANTTNCFLYTTTPEGWEMFAEMVESGIYTVIRLHWTGNYLWHPKGFSPEQCVWDEKQKDVTKQNWPKEWICPRGCKAHPLGGRPHSERFDFECEKLGWNEQDIAQELDINYAKSGTGVFNQDKVGKCIVHLRNNPIGFRYYRLEFDKPEGVKMDMDAESEEDAWYEVAKTWGVVATEVNGGPLRVYREPFSCRDTKCKCGGSGLHTYCGGGDTARNVDGDYDCFYILDITSGDVVAEWHGRLEAKKLGKEWAKICKWYGCATIKQAPPAWAAVEWNELGLVVNETMDLLGIQLHVSKSEDKIRNKRGPYLGVVIQPHNKNRLITKHLVPEINNSDPNNPDFPRLYCPFLEFWLECSTFVHKSPEGTAVRPDRAKMGAQSRSQHDDRVMAMLCTLYGAKDRYNNHLRDYLETDGSYGGMVQEQKLVPANPHPLLQDRNFGRDRQDTAA